MDWFSYWRPVESEQAKSDSISTLDNVLATKSTLVKKLKNIQYASAGLGIASGLTQGITALGNRSLYKAERDNEIQAIENQVLAAQDDIIQTMAYNSDQAITTAARGNVSISSPVLIERFKQGAERAGRDFAMMRANADIQRTISDINYARKKRASFDFAMNKIFGAANTALMVGMGSSGTGWGDTGTLGGTSTIGVNGVPLYGGSM